MSKIVFKKSASSIVDLTDDVIFVKPVSISSSALLNSLRHGRKAVEHQVTELQQHTQHWEKALQLLSRIRAGIR